VRNALAMLFVGETEGLVTLYVAPGAQAMHPSTNLRRGNIRSYDDPFDHEEDTWRDNHALWLARLDEPYSLILFWDGDWQFLCWYVQLQDPMTQSHVGFDTRDHLLDVVVEPDGSWAWKDEDELARAVELGLFDEAQADASRAIARRVLAERPWPTGWEDWRPDPAWTAPRLPEGWDVV
jgi:hypothetical protein